jgi:glycosyltransferase involved in cell wall biosynthesis
MRMRAPKVAIVIGSLARGGSERQIVEFVRAAHPRRAECLVLCLSAEGDLAADVRSMGARVVSLGGGPRAPLALARTLARERPDVVYAFLFWGYVLALPLAALVVPRAGRVEGRRSSPGHDLPRARSLAPLRRLADRCCDVAIANSIATGRDCALAERRLNGRLWVVPNGIRLPALAPEPEPSEDVVIACVANLKPRKGHDVLLNAVAALLGHPRPWRLELVGAGPERPRIERLVAELGLAGRVRLLGEVSDVDRVLARADVAVLPSLTESLPNAVIEAMAHAVPVVATAVGGIPELLGSGAGVTTTPGRSDELTAVLRALIQDEALRRRLGERGRAVVADGLGIERMRDETLAALEHARRVGTSRRVSAPRTRARAG